VLLDAPSFALALAVAALAASGHPGAAAALALPLGATREAGPLFAAVWAWHPAPLVGLLAAGWWLPAGAPPVDAPWLTRPLRYCAALRWHIGLDASLYLRPWGAALAGLVAPSWQTGAALLLAHAQCLVATDTIRLAVWAAPVLVAGAARALPPGWWALALLVTAVQRDERV
jgi:hypothetical protein